MEALNRKEQHAMTQIVAKLRAAEKPKAARDLAQRLLDAYERSDAR